MTRVILAAVLLAGCAKKPDAWACVLPVHVDYRDHPDEVRPTPDMDLKCYRTSKECSAGVGDVIGCYLTDRPWCSESKDGSLSCFPRMDICLAFRHSHPGDITEPQNGCQHPDGTYD